MKSEIDPMDELMKACHCLHLEVADSIAFDVQDKARAVKTELDSLRTQLKSVEADAAVMREALRDAQMHIEADHIDWARFQEGPDHDPNYKPQFPEIVDRCAKSLSTNAGRSLLERLKEAEWLLVNCPNSCDPEPAVFKEWWNRREAFLNPKPQDVK